jgi:hypothetical protein
MTIIEKTPLELEEFVAIETLLLLDKKIGLIIDADPADGALVPTVTIIEYSKFPNMPVLVPI